MGDVVHALPLAADLARNVPDAQIDWLVEESFATIPAMSRHVANVRQLALRRWRRRPFQPRTRSEIAAVKADLRRAEYDWVLDAQGLLKSAWVARWAGAPVAGFSSRSAREQLASMFYARRFDIPRDLHAVDRCRQLGALAFGYRIEDAPQFDLVAPPAPSIELTPPYAALLNNASRETKLWPESDWINVEGWLAQQGISSVLFAGNSEEEDRARELARRMQRATVAPRSSIAAIAGVLMQARLVVGLDTGLSHLAAALGRPTVAIYCDYDPRLVGLIGSGPVESLGGVDRRPAANEVIDAVQRVLERSQ